MKHHAVGHVTSQNRLADSLTELLGKGHCVACQHRDVQAVFAQGGGGLHGDETVADDQRALTGLCGGQDGLCLVFRAQQEHLRKVGTRQFEWFGGPACGEQRGIVGHGLAVGQAHAAAFRIQARDFGLQAVDALLAIKVIVSQRRDFVR
ncbi:hypothetical protein D3C73_799030 [compost metagenome]